MGASRSRREQGACTTPQNYLDRALKLFYSSMKFYREAPVLSDKAMGLLYGLMRLHRETPVLNYKAMGLSYGLMGLHRETPVLNYKAMGLFYELRLLCRTVFCDFSLGWLVVALGGCDRTGRQRIRPGTMKNVPIEIANGTLSQHLLRPSLSTIASCNHVRV